jgi:hypothetical protein
LIQTATIPTTDVVSSNQELQQIKKQEVEIVKGKFYDPNYDNIRTSLSHPKNNQKFNIWTILKEAIGKDLSKFAMPG